MSLKIQLRLQVNHRWPIGIIQEQIPLWSTRLEEKFPRIQVEKLMQAHLLFFKLASVAFYPAQYAHLAAVLSAEIWDLVKAVMPPHYRLGCSVNIRTKRQDDVVVSSQSTWNPHTDSFATSNDVNPTLF